MHELRSENTWSVEFTFVLCLTVGYQLRAVPADGSFSVGECEPESRITQRGAVEALSEASVDQLQVIRQIRVVGKEFGTAPVCVRRKVCAQKRQRVDFVSH